MQSTLEQVPTLEGRGGRELVVGRVISTTFSVWSKHVLRFALLSVVTMAPMVIGAIIGRTGVAGVTVPASPDPLHPTPPPIGAFGPFIVGALLTSLLAVIQLGAITHGVIQHLAGKPVSLGRMAGAGARRGPSLALAGIACYLLVLLGSLLLLVPGIMLACALAATLPAVVAEGIGPGAAIGRSFILTKGNRLRIFAAFAVLFVFNLAVNAVGSFLLPRLTPSAPMVGTLLGLAVNLLFSTVVWVAPAVVYHDLRRAKEGTSASELAAVFD